MKKTNHIPRKNKTLQDSDSDGSIKSFDSIVIEKKAIPRVRMKDNVDQFYAQLSISFYKANKVNQQSPTRDNSKRKLTRLMSEKQLKSRTNINSKISRRDNISSFRYSNTTSTTESLQPSTTVSSFTRLSKGCSESILKKHVSNNKLKLPQDLLNSVLLKEKFKKVIPGDINQRTGSMGRSVNDRQFSPKLKISQPTLPDEIGTCQTYEKLSKLLQSPQEVKAHQNAQQEYIKSQMKLIMSKFEKQVSERYHISRIQDK